MKPGWLLIANGAPRPLIGSGSSQHVPLPEAPLGPAMIDKDVYLRFCDEALVAMRDLVVDHVYEELAQHRGQLEITHDLLRATPQFMLP